MSTAKQRKEVEQALRDAKAYRTRNGQNQSTFWKNLGVTQSGGSRYENSRRIPKPIQLLIALKVLGIVSDDQIAEAHDVINKVGKGSRAT